jgi:hypothetical protein
VASTVRKAEPPEPCFAGMRIAGQYRPRRNAGRELLHRD